MAESVQKVLLSKSRDGNTVHEGFVLRGVGVSMKGRFWVDWLAYARLLQHVLVRPFSVTSIKQVALRWHPSWTSRLCFLLVLSHACRASQQCCCVRLINWVAACP